MFYQVSDEESEVTESTLVKDILFSFHGIEGQFVGRIHQARKIVEDVVFAPSHENPSVRHHMASIMIHHGDTRWYEDLERMIIRVVKKRIQNQVTCEELLSGATRGPINDQHV